MVYSNKLSLQQDFDQVKMIVSYTEEDDGSSENNIEVVERLVIENIPDLIRAVSIDAQKEIADKHGLKGVVIDNVVIQTRDNEDNIRTETLIATDFANTTIL